MQKSDVLTFQECRQHLRVSELVMRKLVKSGVLKAVRVGHQWRIARVHVEEFLKIKERETTQNQGQASAA